MAPDFEHLVAEALEGRPAPLCQALKVMRWKGSVAELPPCVADMFRRFGEVGRARGRPRKGEEKIRAAFRAFVRLNARQIYETERVLAQITADIGGKEIISGREFPPPSIPPSIIALDVIADQLGLSQDAARDLVFPARRKKYTKEKRR